MPCTSGFCFCSAIRANNLCSPSSLALSFFCFSLQELISFFIGRFSFVLQPRVLLSIGSVSKVRIPPETGLLISSRERLTIGLDLGDRASCWCALDASGEVLARGQVVNEKHPLKVLFERIPASLVALEVGTHSAWVSRVLED